MKVGFETCFQWIPALQSETPLGWQVQPKLCLGPWVWLRGNGVFKSFGSQPTQEVLSAKGSYLVGGRGKAVGFN